MLPLQIAGIALTGRMLLSKYSDTTPDKKSTQYRLYPQIKPLPYKRQNFENPLHTLVKGLTSSLSDGKRFRLPTLPRPTAGANAAVANPFQTLFKGLSSTLSQLTKRTAGEDYNAVVEKFVPENAKPIAPQFPANTKPLQFADLDGDSQDELITSYKLNDEIRTLILKKQSDSWYKAAEVNSAGHDTLHFRGAVDITGEGKKQLLVGTMSKDKTPSLYGYTMEKGNANKLFSRNYNRFEVLDYAKTGNAPPETKLAVWNRKDDDTHDIEVLRWNGLELEPVKDMTAYFRTRVVPHFVGKVKQSPNQVSSWYNLADTLHKAEAYSDALIAADVGIGVDKNSEYKDRFLELKKKIKPDA